MYYRHEVLSFGRGPRTPTNRDQPLRIGPQVFNLGSLEWEPYIPNTQTYSLKRGLVPIIQFLKQYLRCRKPSKTKQNSYELPIYCLLVAGCRHQSLGELVRNRSIHIFPWLQKHFKLRTSHCPLIKRQKNIMWGQKVYLMVNEQGCQPQKSRHFQRWQLT